MNETSMEKQRVDVTENANSFMQDIIAINEGQTPSAHIVSKPEKNPAAVALGRLGGLKGGKARAAKLSAEQRTELARHAALSRWSKR
jgi:hypothetical protein